MGYTEQHTLISLATDNDIQAFLKVRRRWEAPGWGWCSCRVGLRAFVAE